MLNGDSADDPAQNHGVTFPQIELASHGGRQGNGKAIAVPDNFRLRLHSVTGMSFSA